MALMPCQECGKSISSKAAACPNCGWRVSTTARIVAESRELKRSAVELNTAVGHLRDARSKANRGMTSVQKVSLIFLAIFALAVGGLVVRKNAIDSQHARNLVERENRARDLAQSATQISTAELQYQWKIDPASAIAKYAGARIIYTGEVDISGAGRVLWKRGGPEVRGFTPEETDRMRPGTTASVTCRVADFQPHLKLDDCYLVRASTE